MPFVLNGTSLQAVSSDHGLLTTVAYKFGKKPAHYALEVGCKTALHGGCLKHFCQTESAGIAGQNLDQH